MTSRSTRIIMAENRNKDVLHTPPADQKTFSAASAVIFFLLCLIPVYGGIAFGAVDTASLGLLSLLSGVIVVCWLADAWSKNEFIFNPNPLQLPLLGLILIGLVQLLPLGSPPAGTAELLAVAPTSTITHAPYETRLAIVKLIVYFIFFAAALTFVNGRERLRKVVLLLVIFGALMAFYGILQRLASPELIYNYRRIGQASPFGSYFNSHHFAAFMEMTIGLTLGLLFGRATKKDKRYLLMIAAGLMGIAILLTNSRGGFLTLLGVVGFVIFANLPDRPTEDEAGDAARPGRKLALVGGGFALIVALFMIVLLLGGDDSLARAMSMSGGQEDISNGRLHFWGIALQNFAAHPILGTGLDSYGIIFSNYDSWNGIFRVEHTHNDYLQILSDAGLAGFICVAAFVYLLFRQGLKKISTAPNPFRRSAAVGALAGCFGIVLHSFVDFPLRTPANGFFFLLLAALAVVTVHYPQRRRKVRRQPGEITSAESPAAALPDPDTGRR